MVKSKIENYKCETNQRRIRAADISSLHKKKRIKIPENIRFRTYKTSINILFFSYYNDSKVYEIKNGKSALLSGLKYSIMTI